MQISCSCPGRDWCYWHVPQALFVWQSLFFGAILQEVSPGKKIIKRNINMIIHSSKMRLITPDSVQEYQARSPKRICFTHQHTGALKRSWPRYEGTFNVPFNDSFGRLFPFPLFPVKKPKYDNPDAHWYSIQNKEAFEEIQSWIQKQGSRVFLRDCLSASIALSYNLDMKGKSHTPIGYWEDQAKNYGNSDAIVHLVHECVNAINSYGLYSQADYIAAVPPSKDKKSAQDLPFQVAQLVAKQTNKQHITENFCMAFSKKPVKTLQLEDRWNEWEKTELSYSGDLTGKTIILIDDKYQSGTSIHYVARKLQEAGAVQVYGLCLVKTMRDTDNQ